MNIPQRKVDRHDWEEMSPRAAYVQAAWMVDRPTAMHLRDTLAPLLNWRDDRQMTLRTLLIGLFMIGILDMPCHHRKIRKALRALPFETQRKLGVINERGDLISYRMIEKAIGQIACTLVERPVLVDHDHPVANEDTGEVHPCPVSCPFMAAGPAWFVTATAMAAVPDGVPIAKDFALDWTDMPTWAKQLFRFSNDQDVAPGDDDPDYHAAATEKAAKTSSGRTTKAPIGPDGRKVPSKDTEARWGHRSARSGVDEFFIGFDAHTMLGTPARRGTKCPPFIFAAEIRPAGSYAGDAAVDLLRTLRYFGLEVRDLIADRGYTRLDPDRFRRPVLEIADNIVLDLMENRRVRLPDWTVVRDKGTPEERTVRIVRIAGGFFSSALPERFHDLARLGPNADTAARVANMGEFDERARYAFVRHGFTAAGTQRWAGPATWTARYKVRCENNPDSMRGPEGRTDTRPLTRCKPGVPCSCGEVVAIKDPTTEREQQWDLWGTTKWTRSNNRRTVVERGYADDKVQITSLDRKHIRCFGVAKHAIYYAPIAAARNLQVALRWFHGTDQPDPWGIQEVSGPDYRLPEELDRLHVAETEGRVSGDRAAGPAERTETEDDEEDSQDVANALPEDSPTPRLNRKQRRLAEKTAKKGRSGNSKPPKPPPQGTSSPTSQ